MRTTVDIDDQLLRAARKRAADEHATLREIFELALKHYLAEIQPRKFNLHWKAHKRGRIRPAVILEDREVLFDLMEGHR